MRVALQLHPDSRCDAVTAVEVEVTRPARELLALRFLASGNIADVIVPPPSLARGRRDELWRHSCFEAFLRTAGPGYLEFNFSPSTDWAAYRFKDYRDGMEPLTLPAPRIAASSSPTQLEVLAVIDLPATTRSTLTLGLAAVIEEADGLSLWAAAHPLGKPDFHHADSFAIELQ